MTFVNQRLLVLRQPGQEREFLALHRRLNAPQAGAAHQHFMRGKDQAQALFPSIARQFRKRELVVRQQQAAFRG